MDPIDLALHSLALLVAVATSLLVDRQAERRRVLPPGFASPGRRGAAAALLAFTFYFSVFGPIAGIGRSELPELTSADAPWLFALHGMMALVILLWYALGFLGVGAGPATLPSPLEEGLAEELETAELPAGEAAAEEGVEEGIAHPPFAASAEAPPAGWLKVVARQLGLITRRPLEDLALGLVGGILAWFGLVAVMMAAVGLFVFFGGEDSLPQQAPEAVAFMVGLPWLVRAALALSAGFFEEAFFRGLLQGRAGVALSTTLFVLAHASYQQPFMLVGLTFLSLVMAALVVWRQNIWPAVVAHATFDLVQLLVVIPQVLDLVAPEAAG